VHARRLGTGAAVSYDIDEMMETLIDD
jgi:hypothetical protein